MTSLPKSMKSAASFDYGNYESIQIVERDIPLPLPNQILVKVKASSLTSADSMMRRGIPRFARLFMGLTKPKNKYLGTGFSGVVTSVGENVNAVKVGEEIFGETGFNFGANSEYAIVDQSGVFIRKPDYISHQEASCVCDGLLTSYNFVEKLGEVKKGQKVLINGGAGSLGSAAIQLAVNKGGHVTATSSPKNFDHLKEMGANETIDYKSLGNLNSKFDIIFDTVGKMTSKDYKPLLENQSKYLTPVLTLSVLFKMLFSSIFGARKKVVFSATGLLEPKVLRNYLDEILVLKREKKLNVPIEKSFDLREVKIAHKDIESGHKRANYVLVFS